MGDRQDLEGRASPWTADPRDLLGAGPGFSVAAMDRAGKPGFDGGKKDGRAYADAREPLLSELQERLFAEGRAGGARSVLCVVQGLDTSGKGGIARHVMARVDPQGVALASFGVPTREELAHHFLWRIKKRLPPPGKIGVFDRSHYEDVLVARVDGLVPRQEWESRYEQINAFEKELVESGTVVLKFALMVSHDEQGVRLMERLDRPDKRWKFSPNDLTTRTRWQAHQQAYQDVIDRTSTGYAPWYVIPADRKWYSRAAVMEILTRTLVEMKVRWPRPDWDPMRMREQLARLMSLEVLRTSLAEIEKNVKGALADIAETRRQSIAISSGHNDDAVEVAGAQADLARIEALKAAWSADLAKTRQHKQELVERARQSGGSMP